MRMIGFPKRKFISGGLLCLVFVMWSSTIFGLGAPLKFSPSHWLKAIPVPPPDMSVAEAICPDIRAMPGHIEAARSEAEEIAGDEMNMERLIPELMESGNIMLLQEMAMMEQQRYMSGGGPQPLKRQQAMTEISVLRKELRTALSGVGDGLPACYMDEKSGETDTACIEKNNRTTDERITKAYNNYFYAVQGPLLKLRKEAENMIGMEASIIQVESKTESSEVHKYMLQQRIGLLDVVRDYARERSNACNLPFGEKKKADE